MADLTINTQTRLEKSGAKDSPCQTWRSEYGTSAHVVGGLKNIYLYTVHAGV